MSVDSFIYLFTHFPTNNPLKKNHPLAGTSSTIFCCCWRQHWRFPLAPAPVPAFLPPTPVGTGAGAGTGASVIAGARTGTGVVAGVVTGRAGASAGVVAVDIDGGHGGGGRAAELLAGDAEAGRGHHPHRVRTGRGRNEFTKLRPGLIGRFCVTSVSSGFNKQRERRVGGRGEWNSQSVQVPDEILLFFLGGGGEKLVYFFGKNLTWV